MVYSSCPSCSGLLPDTPRQYQPSAPAAGTRRIVPHLVIVAGLILVIAVTAFLVQALILHPVAVPMAANASTSPSPAFTPDVSGTPEILTTPSLLQLDLNTTSDSSVPEPLTTTFLTTPVPSPAPASGGPLITIKGNPQYSPNAPVMGNSNKVPVINATSLETQIHELVNRVRQEHGLSDLRTDIALASVARAHSTDMAVHGYFGHLNLDERDATARGAAAGYLCHKAADPYYTYAIAENLYATYRYSSVLLLDGRATGYSWTTEEAMAQEAVDAWMNSPDHRDNILDRGIGREGIGVAFGQGDMVFVTQDFC